MPCTPGHLWHPSLWPSPLTFTMSQSFLYTQGRRQYQATARRATALASTNTPSTMPGRARHAVTTLWRAPEHLAPYQRRPPPLHP
jgi:hypothetical protein